MSRGLTRINADKADLQDSAYFRVNPRPLAGLRRLCKEVVYATYDREITGRAHVGHDDERMLMDRLSSRGAPATKDLLEVG